MNDKLNALENTGMIETMYHQWKRYESVHPLQINRFALWVKWLRS